MREGSQARAPNTQLFHDVFKASPIGIVVEDLNGQPLFVNPAFCSMLGFSEEEMRSKHCMDLSPPEDAEKDWALFQQLRVGSIDHYQLEKRYFRRDGSLFWGRLTISLLNSRRSPLVLAMVEDITDKKNAEEARFRHAAIIESSDDAIASGTLDGIIVTWNAGAQKMYGYSEAEAIGKSINILLPPELPNEENKILETLRAGGHIEHYETVRVTKTGKRIDVSLSIYPIKDSSGKTVGCSGIARDITERKRAQEALRISEERLRLAQWAARIGTFDVNLQTGVDIWQPETEALYGLPSGGFGGTLTAFEDLIHPDDRERVIELTQEMMRNGQPAEGEWRVIWPDGSVHWIAGRGQVLMNESGDPSRMLGVNIDVTEHKQMEEALSHMSNKLLESQEQERARIGRELHDNINQQIAMLAIELGHLAGDPSDVQSRLRMLQEQMTELSNDVQSLSHELHSSKLEYLGVVSGIRSWCKEFADRQKIVIDFKSSVSRVVPLEIGITLFRVLQEAVHNALKHSGVKRLEVEIWERRDEIQLVVNDLGKGFDVDAAVHGRGLGLTSMQERVRLVNGNIEIQSKPMSGTTIHVRVPFKSKPRAQRTAG